VKLLDDDERREQLMAAPNATERDAAPRVELSEHDGITRIDIADSAAVRPGKVTRRGSGKRSK
jgi:hypothetical protein